MKTSPATEPPPLSDWQEPEIESSGGREEVWDWWMTFCYIGREQWRIVLGGLLLSIALTCAFYGLSTRVYEAKAIFIVEQSPFLSESSDKLELLNAKDPLVNFIASIRTANLARSVADQMQVPEENIAMSGVTRKAALSRPHTANIEISALPDSRAVQVRVESSVPRFATDVADIVLKELELLNRLAGRINSIDAEIKLTGAQLGTINQSLSAVTADRIRQEEEIKMLDEHLHSGGSLEFAVPFAADVTLVEMLSKQTELRTSLHAQAAISTRGLVLATLAAAVDSIGQQIKEYTAELDHRLRSSYRTEVSEEGALRQSLRKIQDQIETLQDERTQIVKSVGDSQLRRNLGLEDSSKTWKEASVVLVMDRPVVPVRPIRPSLLLFAIFNVILGSVLGPGGGLAAHFADRHIQTPRQMVFRSGVPCLAVLPAADAPKSLFMDKSAQTGLSFLSNLMMRAAMEGGGQVYVFSPIGASGDHAVWVARLAVLLAKAQQRTLIVDLDFHQPRVAQILGIEPRKSLLQWFNNDDPLRDFIQYSVLQELAILHPGQGKEAEEVLISRRPLGKSLLELQAEWDFILIVSPSLIDDFRLLVAAPPGAIMVGLARYGVATFGDLSTAVTLGKTYRLQFAGVVIHDYPKKLLSGVLSSFALGTHQYMLKPTPAKV